MSLCLICVFVQEIFFNYSIECWNLQWFRFVEEIEIVEVVGKGGYWRVRNAQRVNFRSVYGGFLLVLVEDWVVYVLSQIIQGFLESLDLQLWD